MKPAVEITAATATSAAAQELQNWVMWSVFVLAIVLYALLPAFGIWSADGEAPPFLIPALAVVAAWTAAASLALRHWLLVLPARRADLDLREPAGAARFRGISLVNWALAESIGIYGLVISRVGGGDAAALAFFAASALLLLMHAPRGAGFRPAPSIEELARGRGSVS